MITLCRLDEADRRSFVDRGVLPGPVAGLTWHPDYPSTNTLIGYRMLLGADPVRPASTPWWMYHVARNGEVVGNIGFHGPPDEAGGVEIGYDIVTAAWGRGIATQACRLIVGLARSAGAAEVRAETDPDNVASQRVLIKNGFLVEPDDRPVADDGTDEIRYRLRW